MKYLRSMELRVFHRYMIQDFLVIIGLTLTVFTFVMCIGPLIKVIDLLARGVAGSFLLSIFLFNIPYAMSFSIPISSLTANLLLFGRLSMDGEITAMRASGMSIWQISSPIVFISILLTFICLALNFYTSPQSHYARRIALVKAGEMNPLDLLEEGMFNKEFPGLQVYVGKIQGNKILDVIINEMDGTFKKRSIRGEYGFVRQNKREKTMRVEIHNARIEEPNRNFPNDFTKGYHFGSKKWTQEINLKERLNIDHKIKKNRKDMIFPELFNNIRNVRDAYPGLPPDQLKRIRNKMIIETNKRMTLALSCFSLALLGIPLGMKSRRKESSIGFLISLLLMFTFYGFVITAESLSNYPQYFPELIMWIPVFASQVIGVAMMKRIR